VSEESAGGQRLGVLAAAIQAFSEATIDPLRLLDTVAKQVSEVVGDFCTVHLIAETGDALMPVALYDADPEALACARAVVGEPVYLSRHPMVKQAFETGTPMTLPVTPETSSGTTPQFLGFVEKMKLYQVALIPLRVRGTSIGILSLMRFRPERGMYTEDDLALARALADLAALAIASSRSSAAEQLFRSLLESAPDAMVIMDRHGTVSLINAQTERLFGYTRDELIGQKVERLIPERYRERHDARRGPYFDDPKNRVMGSDLELFARRKDGSEFPVEVSVSPIMLGGQTLVSGAIRDITERKRLEDKTREANRLKSEFLANMSHELRTPLNAIIGFTELMHRGKAGPVADEHRVYLGDILTSARHLLRLINDVLDLSKIESGKMEFQPESVDLVAVVSEVRDILRGLASRKKLEIEIAVEPAVATAVTDPTRLKQVLYNYLSNAIKFTPEGGNVTVRVRPEGADHVRIEVEDTGIGIAEVDLPQLFVEFHQLDRSTNKRFGGTGLGLALVKRVVEAQGGRVEVASTPGKGSVLAAVIPRRLS
jgi:protein-histidine pros-kinase